ncbi:MAG: hypothetical protein D6806_00525 [Deltaproteobacteria bacterium]|nr:MAG: hypothetical protein D6806_00525 [Deltaproteobacteria bacterium]
MASEKTLSMVCTVPAAAGGDWVRPAGERRDDFAPVQVLPAREQARRLASQCLATVECRFCEVCQLLCPDLCITRDPASGRIEIDLEYCKGCGLCAHYCPKGAIKMVLEERTG